MSPRHASPAQLQARLAELGIATETVCHAPVFTVAEAQRLRGEIPGGHCKCLFLKNKKGAMWLVVAREAAAVDLKALARALGAGRLSFAWPDLVTSVLGVEPGSVTPFALINATAACVQVVLDAEMLAHAVLNYHPLTNTASTSIASADLLRFVAASGHEPYIIDLNHLPAVGGGEAARG